MSKDIFIYEKLFGLNIQVHHQIQGLKVVSLSLFLN